MIRGGCEFMLPQESPADMRPVSETDNCADRLTDSVYEDSSRLLSSEEKYHGSAIQDFYRGTNILVTGGTGFMGKVLIEKLLRCCPHINSIYLLVRSKKGKDVDCRIRELFQDPLFGKLRVEQPGLRQKLRIIPGECSNPDLGLSPDDQKNIQEHVNIVFHVAATVKFDEKLQIAVPINVRATRDLLRLCKGCSNLKALIHVSTAYTHCYRSEIDEKFYNSRITGDNAVKFVDCLDEDTLVSITPNLLGEWPNTYTFTKAIAEDTVKTYGKGLPVGVLRPSIIVCTREDPVVGWIDNLYGPTGAVVGVGVGMIRTMHIDMNATADLVPCDMVVSALIASAWDVHERKKSGSEEIPIYNYVSSCEKSISWGEYINTSVKYSWQAPFNKAVWMITFTHTKVQFLYKICALLLHILPALLVDAVLFSTGQKPMMMKTYDKLHKFTYVISYFCTRQWKFTNQNVQQLWLKMNDEDQRLFDFNMKGLDWHEYCKTTLFGIRTFLLKDDPKSLSEAIRRRHRLYWLHQIVKWTVVLLCLWLCWIVIEPVLQWTGRNSIVCKPISDRHNKPSFSVLN